MKYCAAYYSDIGIQKETNQDSLLLVQRGQTQDDEAAVSYTHLDVYKRQLKSTCLSVETRYKQQTRLLFSVIVNSSLS